jgi:Cu2+-containing amine oxidase
LFDVSANGFSFAPIAQHGAVARPAPAAPCHHNGVILEEIRDDDVRWIDDRRNSLVRRGQELVVWAALDAGNYRYIVRYGFADDGSVRARVGATAANLHHRRPDRDPSQNVEARDDIHVHMAGWRIELNLGRPEANNVALVERRPCSAPEVSCAVGRGAVLQRRPFEREGGVRWSPEAFSMLAIENGEPPTPRRPMARQGYTLIPRSAGAVRSSRPFGDNDFWVTRRDPDATGAGGCPQRIAPEWTYVDLPTFGACPQALSGQAAVIWHQSAAYHWPRGEDYGPEGQDRTAGVATTAWSGFDLVPRDVVVGTPLFDR